MRPSVVRTRRADEVVRVRRVRVRGRRLRPRDELVAGHGSLQYRKLPVLASCAGRGRSPSGRTRSASSSGAQRRLTMRNARPSETVRVSQLAVLVGAGVRLVARRAVDEEDASARRSADRTSAQNSSKRAMRHVREPEREEADVEQLRAAPTRRRPPARAQRPAVLSASVSTFASTATTRSTRAGRACASRSPSRRRARAPSRPARTLAAAARPRRRPRASAARARARARTGRAATTSRRTRARGPRSTRRCWSSTLT